MQLTESQRLLIVEALHIAHKQYRFNGHSGALKPRLAKSCKAAAKQAKKLAEEIDGCGKVEIGYGTL